MKFIATSLLVLSGTFGSVSWAAGPPIPTNPAASAGQAASTQAQPAPAASSPTSSPSVRAAADAQQPGKLRPESAVVPQLTIPLRAAAQPADAGLPLPAQVNGQREERAAACAAHLTREERLKCERSL